MTPWARTNDSLTNKISENGEFTRIRQRDDIIRCIKSNADLNGSNRQFDFMQDGMSGPVGETLQLGTPNNGLFLSGSSRWIRYTNDGTCTSPGEMALLSDLEAMPGL